MSMFYRRQGQMEKAYCYFFTQTIQGFKHLLKNDEYKEICIESLKYLVSRELIRIYGYVIMPNHIHLLWNILEKNGMESPAASFAKYTAHRFKKQIMASQPWLLNEYAQSKVDRSYQFWKRDPLAIPISSKEIFIQKLEYIHNNPVKEKWGLVGIPENYRWSSAGYYSTGIDEFGLLTHFDE